MLFTITPILKGCIHMKDLKRAYELANYINSHKSVMVLADPDYDSTPVQTIIKNCCVIKAKTSNSSFYDNNELYSRSIYRYYVPKEVFKEAKELYNIRKANEGNDNFDFYKTAYTSIVIRSADHPHDGHDIGDEIDYINRRGACYEKWEALTEERKRAAYKEQKEQLKHYQEWLAKNGDNIVGATVNIDNYGQGTVINIAKGVITIDFNGNKKYFDIAFLIGHNRLTIL